MLLNWLSCLLISVLTTIYSECVNFGCMCTPYLFNYVSGFFAFVVSLLAFGAALYYKLPVTIVYEKFLQIMTTAVLSTFFFSAVLYIKSRWAKSSALCPAANTG